MAKIKASTQFEEEQNTTSVNEQNPISEVPVVETSDQKIKSLKSEGYTEPDEYTMNILRTFPTYQSIYIDNQGGFYTLDTPEGIRGKAVLYKNPYYKS